MHAPQFGIYGGKRRTIDVRYRPRMAELVHGHPHKLGRPVKRVRYTAPNLPVRLRLWSASICKHKKWQIDAGDVVTRPHKGKTRSSNVVLNTPSGSKRDIYTSRNDRYRCYLPNGQQWANAIAPGQKVKDWLYRPPHRKPLRLKHGTR